MTCHVSPLHLGEYLPYQTLVVETFTDSLEARRQEDLPIPMCGTQQCKGHDIWWKTQPSEPMLAYLVCLYSSLAPKKLRANESETRNLQV